MLAHKNGNPDDDMVKNGVCGRLDNERRIWAERRKECRTKVRLTTVSS